MDKDEILELIDTVAELVTVNDFLGDEHAAEALALIVRIIQKPDIPIQTVAPAIVKLQAISSLCAVRASVYKNLTPGKAGTEEYKRKNMYYSLHEAMNELCAAMKYLIRQQ